MKHFTRTLIALCMAVLCAALLPAQVFAEGPEYISEVKVGIGSTSQLEKDGYTILKDKNGKAVDINTDAGGGYGSKGDQEVYLGYKTTTDKAQAITDLALMNMKGGYSVQEYEILMETQMKSQIIPFVESFLTTIHEYRANYNSEIEANRERALYFHDMLNKLTDDDCGGKGLGDLFLNETKYEMGVEAYNALSDAEKAKTDIVKESDKAYAALSEEERQNHADILTIIAQANGQATLLLQELLTRAADDNEDNWLDRFAGLTYDDLLSVTPGRTATDKGKALAKQYDDDANEILEMWDAFREQLLGADDAKEKIEETDESQIEQDSAVLSEFDLETATDQDTNALVEASVNTEIETELFVNRLNDYVAKEFLADIPYGDGTMLDFFTQEYDEVEDDITVLYPLVASLSDGQRAGLQFLTLSTLVASAGTTAEAYRDAEMDEIGAVSIYEGVDRAIYEKGGVALTSDALRRDAESLMANDSSSSFPFNWWTIVSASAALASAVAFGVTVGYKISTVRSISNLNSIIANNAARFKDYDRMVRAFSTDSIKLINDGKMTWKTYDKFYETIQTGKDQMEIEIKGTKEVLEGDLQRLSARSATCNKLMIGVGVAMIVLTAVTTYLAWKDMHDFYKVDFTPIPRYMVDEKDLVSYNKKGEMIILKNQSAYYKAVESTMKKGDFKYDEIGSLADLNGCVGKQWLALYAAKTEAEEPIIASSLKAVINSSNIPAGYQTGLHMFGSDAAFNLNDSHFDWNDDADSVYGYFQRDDAPLSTAGTGFSGGTLALGAAAGLMIGVLGTVLIGAVTKKRKAKAIA